MAIDDDLPNLTREELIAEVIRLRAGIRAHRDSSGHDLCWHHPQLWNLPPEPISKDLAVPDWPQFLRGCIKYREALDRELPDAPRTDAEFDKGVEPLSEREAHFLVLLMPLVLVGDIAAFALCFWWYDLGLPLSNRGGNTHAHSPLARDCNVGTFLANRQQSDWGTEGGLKR